MFVRVIQASENYNMQQTLNTEAVVQKCSVKKV